MNVIRSIKIIFEMHLISAGGNTFFKVLRLTYSIDQNFYSLQYVFLLVFSFSDVLKLI